ncbi:hypothetical protein V2J09_003998 [Rumex salicifolius]
MPESAVEICCKGIIAFVIAAGLTALFIWVGLRGFEPTCILNRLEIPALNARSSSSAAASFTVTLDNKRNKDTGVYYDPLNLTFSYKNATNSNRSSATPVGSATINGFHQSGGKAAKKNGSFISGGAVGNAVFRVDMRTEIRPRDRWEVGADVSLDGDGSLVLKKQFIGRKKGVKLTSGAGGLDSLGVVLKTLLLSSGVSLLF